MDVCVSGQQHGVGKQCSYDDKLVPLLVISWGQGGSNTTTDISVIQAPPSPLTRACGLSLHVLVVPVHTHSSEFSSRFLGLPEPVKKPSIKKRKGWQPQEINNDNSILITNTLWVGRALVSVSIAITGILFPIIHEMAPNLHILHNQHMQP